MAPAAGTVIEVVDGVTDNLPLKTANSHVNAGNHIVIKHSDTAFSFIAHFKQHSIQVKAGEKVNKGQVLGQCGNSGYSTMPHLHYHLQDSPVVVEWHGTKPKAKAKGKKVTFSNINLFIDGHEQHKTSYSPVKLDLVENDISRT